MIQQLDVCLIFKKMFQLLHRYVTSILLLYMFFLSFVNNVFRYVPEVDASERL